MKISILIFSIREKNTAIECTVEFLKLDFNWPIAKDFAQK